MLKGYAILSGLAKRSLPSNGNEVLRGDTLGMQFQSQCRNSRSQAEENDPVQKNTVRTKCVLFPIIGSTSGGPIKVIRIREVLIQSHFGYL